MTGIQNLSIHSAFILKTSHWYRFHPLYLSISPVLWHKCQGVIFIHLPLRRHAWRFYCLMINPILITTDNGRGHCMRWQSCKVPNKTHRKIQKWKLYAIKKLRSDQNTGTQACYQASAGFVSGTPGLGPIAISPGSWQTSLNPGACPGILHRSQFD